MIRHKFVDCLEWESDWMNELKAYGVAKEYEYSKWQTVTGAVFDCWESGSKEQYLTVASNWIRQYKRWQGSKCRVVKYRIMYLLNSEGEDYIKSLLIEKRLTRRV